MAMDQFLECPICCDFATNAVESECCHKIFCDQCVKDIDFSKYQSGDNSASRCPLCRKSPFKTKESTLARRMIGSLPIDCPFKCDLSKNGKVTRDSLSIHIKNCPNKPIDCTYPNCQFSGILSNYTNHIIEKHSDLIITSFDSYNNNNNTKNNSKNNNNNNNNSNNNNNNSSESKNEEKNNEDDIIKSHTNSRGYRARLGKTGKFYCGKEFIKYNCNCCNGYCGPTNGCNCYACMELDIKTRKLPNGYLVNNKGYNARKSNYNNKWYCGRYFGKQTNTHDGYCGPTNGSCCKSCQLLNLNADKKYGVLLNSNQQNQQNNNNQIDFLHV